MLVYFLDVRRGLLVFTFYQLQLLRYQNLQNNRILIFQFGIINFQYRFCYLKQPNQNKVSLNFEQVYEQTMNAQGQQNITSSANMNQKQLNDDYNNLYKPSFVLDNVGFEQNVENDIYVRESQLNLRQEPEAGIFESRNYIQNTDEINMKNYKQSQSKSFFKIKKQQLSQKNSQYSGKSYKSATTQQIIQKYQISSIMRRKGQQQEQKSNKRFFILKLLFTILLFPFSLIFLLICCVINKKQKSYQSQSTSSNPQSSQLNSSKILTKNKHKYKTKISNRKRYYKFRKCIQNQVLYYVFCECFQDTKLFKKCCKCVERCCKCMCENRCMQCCQNCCYLSCNKSCQICFNCLCCCNRTHEKVDTLERLQKMNRKYQI